MSLNLHRLIKPELEQLISECNFTQEELDIFTDLSKGKSRVEISMKMNISIQCLDKHIRNIREKIERCQRWKSI